MAIALQIIQIILSVAIIVLVLIQAKGAGLGSIFGGDSGVYRTRRGLEKTVYQATVGLSVVFFLVSILSVSLSS